MTQPQTPLEECNPESRVEVARLTLTWTSEPPTEPGDYKIRRSNGELSFETFWRANNGDLVDESGANLKWQYYKTCEFAGPIPEPKEPTND